MSMFMELNFLSFLFVWTISGLRDSLLILSLASLLFLLGTKWPVVEVCISFLLVWNWWGWWLPFSQTSQLHFSNGVINSWPCPHLPSRSRWHNFMWLWICFQTTEGRHSSPCHDLCAPSIPCTTAILSFFEMLTLKRAVCFDLPERIAIYLPIRL